MFELHVDTRELDAFAAKMRTLTRDGNYIKQALAEAGEEYLKDVIAVTPVNKILEAPTRGQLKARWRKDNKNLFVKVRETNAGYVLELVNTTPYASWVEKGHRAIPGQYVPILDKRIRQSTTWVMGQFFVRKTEVKWQNGKLDRSLSTKIGKWISHMLEEGK